MCVPLTSAIQGNLPKPAAPPPTTLEAFLQNTTGQGELQDLRVANLLLDTTGLPQLWGFMAVFHKPCFKSTFDIGLHVVGDPGFVDHENH